MDVPEYHELVGEFWCIRRWRARSKWAMPPPSSASSTPARLSASCWARLASHLPAGTPVKVLELEAINRYWAHDPALTVDGARRPAARRGCGPARAACSWAGASAASSPTRSRTLRARRVVVLDGARSRRVRRADRGRAAALVRHVRRRPPRRALPSTRRGCATARAACCDVRDVAARRAARGHDARDRRALLRGARRPRPARPPADRGLRAVGRAADRRQGRAQPRAGQPGARLGPLRAGRDASPAAAITTRCSPSRRRRGASGDAAAALARAGLATAA